MNKKEQTLQGLLQQKLLPLYYHDSAKISIEVLKSLYAAGIRTIEYTNRGENALVNFKAIRKVADESLPSLELGVGTIKTKTAAQEFIDAGADFVVCPTMNEEVAKTVHAAGLLWIPGCLSVTEIANAEIAGATLVKIFPGDILGPSYISSIKEIFPELKFMPTGGVELEEKNLRSWFEAGVVAVGMGSKLITKAFMQNGEYESIKKNAATSMQLIKNVAVK